MRIPRALGKTIPREGILRTMRADGASSRFVTVISAPAGSGKTTLLSHRGRQLHDDNECVAWLALDRDDNDPFVFWSGVLSACELALRSANIANHPLTRIHPPHGVVPPEFLADFGHEVESLPSRLWLILDDMHELAARETLDGLTRLLRNPPQNMRLIIGCRYDPPLPLARMTLNETASEIRAADLAFDHDETSLLLESHGLHLDDTDIDLLLDRTEGWAAGLKLAALWMARYDDPKPRLAQFLGDERPVADYLVSEVLSHQSAETRDLLLAVAVPERLSVELADELSGRVDAGAVLEQLAHDNALVYREDGPSASYRLHSLLRSYLLAELGRRDMEAKRELHARASDWFDRQGLDGLALSHATMSADWKTVVHLLSTHGLQLVLAGDRRPVERALEVVPDEAVDRPDISLLGALCALSQGDLASAETYLDRAAPGVDASEDPDIRAVNSAVTLYRDRLSGAHSPHITAPASSAERTELNLLTTANRGMIRLVHGDFKGADIDLNDALHTAVHHRFDFIALDCLAHLTVTAAALDDHEQMLARIGEAIEFADARGWSSTVAMVPVYLMAAWSCWESLDTDGADTMVSLAGAVEGEVEPEVAFSIAALRTYVDFLSPGRDIARTRAALRRTWGENVPLPPKAVSQHCLTELQLAMTVRDGAWVDEILAKADRMLAGTPDLSVLHALTDLHRSRNDHARDVLKPVTVDGEPCETVSAEIAAWLTEAHLADLNDQPVSVHNALIKALARAAPVNAKRDIAHASDRVKSLLSSHRGRLGNHERFVHDVMVALRHNEHASSAMSFVAGEALTERELGLLHELPSLLSLAEIADAHVVSLNTVKTHLKAIYRKLDVGSRREAVERAREFGLI